MAYETLPTFAVDKAVDYDYLNKIRSNFEDHEARIAAIVSSIVPNGSFENVDGSGDPTGWTRTVPGAYTSGTQTTDQAEGERCLYVTSPGGTGLGDALWDSDYMLCGLRAVILGFAHWSSVANLHNQVLIRWYDKDKIYLAGVDSTIYDESAVSPTTKQFIVNFAVAPSGARFFKVRIVGAKNDLTTAGTAYFDAVQRIDTWPEKVFSTVTETTFTAVAGAGWTDVPTGVTLSFYVPPGVCRAVVKGQASVSVDGEIHYRWKHSTTTFSNETTTPASAYAPVVHYIDLSTVQGTNVTLTLQYRREVVNRTGGYKREAGDQTPNDFFG